MAMPRAPAEAHNSAGRSLEDGGCKQYHYNGQRDRTQNVPTGLINGTFGISHPVRPSYHGMQRRAGGPPLQYSNHAPGTGLASANCAMSKLVLLRAGRISVPQLNL